MQRLAPLMEEPMDQEEQEQERGGRSMRTKSWKKWIKTQLQSMIIHKTRCKGSSQCSWMPSLPVPSLSKMSLQQVTIIRRMYVISSYCMYFY